MSKELDNIIIPELLPFKDDYIFKTVLTRPESDIVRNSMLSAFTGLDIIESTINENEPPIDLNVLEKQIRLDVNCKTSQGKRINIEMQAYKMDGDNSRNQHINLRNRSVYYTSKLFAVQSADDYDELKQTFHIMVCNYNIFEDDNFLHRFSYSDGNIILTDITSIIFVELPKIKSIADRPFEELTPQQQWAVLIECADNKKFIEKIRSLAEKEEFKMAMDILGTIRKDENECLAYISHLKFQTDLKHSQNVARKEGAIQKAFETARTALNLMLPIEQIKLLTGLPEEEIEKLSSQ